MTPQEKLAKILRATPEVILDMEDKMSKITKKTGVIKDLMLENQHRIGQTLASLNCKKYKAENVRKALLKQVREDDFELYKLFKKPKGTTSEGLQTLFSFAKELAGADYVYVLKKEKAEEILYKNPPPNIMKALGYKNAEELLKKEDLIEVFCALRFVESKEWMHKTFDETYKKLTPDDFEKRKIDLRVLSGKWLDIAEKFVEKKYHNISHLKELGVLFIIPLKITTAGETLRMFSLILHYLHELKFYSDLFEKQAEKGKNFGENIIFLLKGKVLEELKQDKDQMNWLIIQQYLAKDDENDKRLFIPHVNPEALHWQRAEKNIQELGVKFKNTNLEIWLNLDWVGDFFENKHGKELVSFDLVDNVMALVKKEEKIKYLYHQQEALWNEIFENYLGTDKLEKLMMENFDKGYIDLKF